MTTHTPGPWTICFDGQIDSGEGKSYKMICRFNTDTYKEMVESGDLANAKLISASPNLLDACQSVLTSLDNMNIENDHTLSGCHMVLQEAIKKATS